MGQRNWQRLGDGATIANATLSGTTTVNAATTISGNTTLSGTNSITGATGVSGSGWIPRKIVTEATAARTISATDYDALIVLTGAAGATTLTLPTPAAGNAGAVVRVISQSNHAHVVALANKIVAPNTVTSDSLTAADANKTGQSVTLVSDGSKWVLVAWTGSWTVAA